MTAAHAYRRVAAPLARVWAAATDLAGAEQRRSGLTRIEQFTDGPFRAGTRWRETRISAGRPITEDMEVVEATPPTRFVVEVRSGQSTGRSTTTLTARGPDATLVEISLDTVPSRGVGHLVDALFGVFAARAVLATLHRDLDDLARWCERPEDSVR